MFTVLCLPQDFDNRFVNTISLLQKTKKKRWVNTIFINMEDFYNKNTFINSFLALSSHKKYSLICIICYSDNNLEMLGNIYPLNITQQSVIKTNLLKYKQWLEYQLVE